MAGASLKRAHDSDNLNQRPAKRRRCNPFEQSTNGSRACSRSNPHDSMPGCSLNSNPQSPGSSRSAKAPQPSPFTDSGLANMSADKMAENIHDEIKRLHRRKQLRFSAAAIERMQD